jgi:beta-galactosidase
VHTAPPSFFPGGKPDMMNPYPFLFGSQYYRAPTPEPGCWEEDFAHMRDLGFNAVKFFVQWRWSHRAPDRFCFDDLDALMDLAGRHGLGVTLNTLTDMSPLWLFEEYPDAKQINASGEVIEPYTVSHRSIGGHPGPCYNHPGALAERQRFLAEVVDHFRDHPALAMWDMWNEPEQSFQARVPDLRTVTCYCPHCREGFVRWLQAKYGELDRVNAVWGRCYETWEQVEMPRTGGAITDFVDWREFHLDVMTAEAQGRLDLARERDPNHPVYLHVVPNVMTCFSSVTGVDDFALARHCDLFAASMNPSPASMAQVVSAGQGRVCYNVESHVNFGSIGMHQRILGLPDLLADWLPQIGQGVKGFMFWQFRSEVLGAESPAWGVVKLDGGERPITRTVRAFWAAVKPHAEALRQAFPAPPEIGVWKSRKNEVFHFAVNGSLASLVESVEGYINALYWGSYPCRIISDDMLAGGDLGGLRFLIMPSCYYVTEAEAQAVDAWVRSGGTLLCEAHLAGYNGTRGRHSRVLPGCGLAEAWGIREADSTSSYHLRLAETEAFQGSMPDDVRKALQEAGTAGGRFFPIRLADGSYVWGANRYAILEGEDVAALGSFDGVDACIASKRLGEGRLIYCGTNLGEGACRDARYLERFLVKELTAASVSPTMAASSEVSGTVHVDLLHGPDGPAFMVVVSRAEQPQTVSLAGEGRWRGLFSGDEWVLPGEGKVPPGRAELLVRRVD